MVTIGLISEGMTDHIVIKHVISGYLDDPDVFITELQPRIDPNNASIALDAGNWDQVFKYCKDSDFEEGLRANPSLYAVIHLDSDVFRTKEVPKKYSFNFNRSDGTTLTTPEIISEIKALLIAEIGQEVYDKYADRILFAIAVDKTECWLLPFYETGKARSKEVNCLKALNRKISPKSGFTIHKKQAKYYLKVAKPLLKHKNFIKLYHFNPSLHIFCEQLNELPDNIEELDNDEEE